MLGRTTLVLSTAYAALLVDGLLLPPGISHPVQKLDLLSTNPKERNIRLPCPSCVFSPAERAADLSESSPTADNIGRIQAWTPGASNDIQLNFRISSDGKELLFNGQRIYPHVFQGFDESPNSIYVDPVSISSSVVKPLEITASALRIEQEHHADDHGDVVVPIRYGILALDELQMKGLPEVEIDLLKTNEGDLFILEMQRVGIPSAGHQDDSHPPPPPPPSPPHFSLDGNEECALWPRVLCHVKDVIDEKLDGFRHADRPVWDGVDRMRPPFDALDELDMPPPPPPPPHDHHSHHHPHHHFDDVPPPPHHPPYHHVFHSIVRGLVGALIPILAGITVGLSVSFIALTIGRAIAWSLSQMRGTSSSTSRRSSRHQRRLRGHPRGASRDSITPADLAEGKVLMADDEVDIPPAYENAPAYEEVPLYSDEVV